MIKNKEDIKDFSSKLLKVNRVSKVVKGGKRFSFSALVVVGDKNGRMGYAMGSASDVSAAVKKATDKASRNMFSVSLKEKRTILYDVEAKYGAARVVLRKAPPGSGIIAGQCMGAAFELLGLRDIVAKSLGSSTPHNVIRAVAKALQSF